MAINVLWNKRFGPGGGARRLHHKDLRNGVFLWGRIRIDVRSKDMIFARHSTTVSDYLNKRQT